MHGCRAARYVRGEEVDSGVEFREYTGVHGGDSEGDITEAGGASHGGFECGSEIGDVSAQADGGAECDREDEAVFEELVDGL